MPREAKPARDESSSTPTTNSTSTSSTSSTQQRRKNRRAPLAIDTGALEEAPAASVPAEAATTEQQQVQGSGIAQEAARQHDSSVAKEESAGAAQPVPAAAPAPEAQAASPKTTRKRRKPKLGLEVEVNASGPPGAGSSLPTPGSTKSPLPAVPAAVAEEAAAQLTPQAKWHKAGTLAQVQVALESRSVALLDAAATTEPAITALLEGITQRPIFSGARMHGLDFKFKGLSSLIRKVLSKWREDTAKREKEDATKTELTRTDSDKMRGAKLDLHHQSVTKTLGQGLRTRQIVDLLAQQNDCLRYTMIFPDDVYVQGVHATLDAIEKSASPRIRRLKLKNFWRPNDADREYLGLHATFECLVDDHPEEQDEEEGEEEDEEARGKQIKLSKVLGGGGNGNKGDEWTNGTRFEVQWHTEATIHTKEEQCHLIYEKFRVDLNVDHKAQYWEEMVGLWSTINMPAGAENIGKSVTAKFDAFESVSGSDGGLHSISPPSSPRMRSKWQSELEKGAALRKQRAALLGDPEITEACERAHRAARAAEPALHDLLTYICGVISQQNPAGGGSSTGGTAGVARLHGERNQRVMTSMTLRRKVVAALLTGQQGKMHVNIFMDGSMIARELDEAQRDMLDFTVMFNETEQQQQPQPQQPQEEPPAEKADQKSDNEDKAALKASMQQLFGRMFDILDANWSGALDEREVNGFCAALIQAVEKGSVELLPVVETEAEAEGDSPSTAGSSMDIDLQQQTTKAFIAALVDTCRAVASLNSGNGSSMTKRQFVEAEPRHAVRAKVEPHYSNVLLLCRRMLASNELTAK
jgi:hypothetical protein